MPDCHESALIPKVSTIRLKPVLQRGGSATEKFDSRKLGGSEGNQTICDVQLREVPTQCERAGNQDARPGAIILPEWLRRRTVVGWVVAVGPP